MDENLNEETRQQLADGLERVRQILYWFRSSRPLRIYYGITSLPREHLSLIDRFIDESLGVHDLICDEDRLRQLTTSCLFLVGSLNNEIMPVLNRELVHVGPGRNSESLTQLKLTRDAADQNAVALQKHLCHLRVETLKGCSEN
ncbi:MAG: hypothetical protein ACOCRN_05015 [Spirochaetia bacterium]